MNRYLYYIIFINMLAGMVASVPKTLMQYTTNGSIVSMILGIIAGLICIYFFIRFFTLFEEKGLPELLKSYLPAYIRYPILFLCLFVWFTAGLITLITYSFMLKRYLIPDMSLLYIAGSFLVFISYGVLMKTRSILYTIETVLVFFIPFIFFIGFKFYTSDYLEWDFIRVAMTHINELPNYNPFSASFYLFLGVANLIIFNRTQEIKRLNIGWKQMLLIGLVGTSILFTTYFIPIGMNGFDHIGELIYPALITSDTFRMSFGIIERVLYFFLMIYLAITFLGMLIHWHVAIEITKEMVWFKNFQWNQFNLTPFLFLALFWGISLSLITKLSEYDLFHYTRYFFNSLPPIFFFMLLIFWFIKRRARS